jgi:DNA-directed RNA polymerase specialized sigma24 family protein
MNSQCRAISQNFDARLNAAIFERLLQWLGPDSHSASLKYESIRARLVTMFRARRCVFAEDLADMTFERVAHKLTNLTSRFIGDPVPYFYGVARKIYLEYVRKLNANQLRATCGPPTSIDDPESENLIELLERALSTISNVDRELILRYYAWDGKNKAAHRRALANQLGIGLNALRLRVFRIRMEIKKNMVQLDAELVTKYLPPRDQTLIQ